ncbi:MAG: bifunctional diaminohydroxyphosphoribosylaminopyrimidine deaminase/5-amino-6-(5-phosphoribosylamino)uracil reductase RibD, partial [Bacteroidota bacterium]
MNDEQYMYRCLQLAEKGMGTTAPNPMVGAVIVYQDLIIGEGWHRKFGESHAEINALHDVKDHSLLKQSILYVNLEPCSHFGKTPPCADAIIKHQLQRVVIGMQDPFNEVNGAGIKKLLDAGINVTVNVLEDECRFLNRRFITYHTKKRPYILLKWAESADSIIGRIGEKINISNSFSQQLVHRWRSEEAGIMVGAHTLKNDNPQLNV